MPTPTPHSLALETRVENLLAQMTLEEQVGQLFVIGFDGTWLTPELRTAVKEMRVGGVVFFERNFESPRAGAQFARELQELACENGMPGLIICIDQEGGIVARLKEDKGFSEFPGAMAIGATGDPNNARRVALAMAEELNALGINMDLAPDLDVNNNPLNPVIGTRSFGSEPRRVAAFGLAFAEGLQAAGVMAVGKHFPGHGDTGVDSHAALPTVAHDRARLEQIELVPFRAAMQDQIAGIMSAHITFPVLEPTPGLAATLSPKVLAELIRAEIKYDGLVLTDSLEMGALATSGYPAPHAAALAFRAGADLLLFNRGFDVHRTAFQMIVDEIRNGNIPPARLDQSVRRILRAKARFGLLDAPPLNVEASAQIIGTAEHKMLAREIAAQAVTLVRDDARLIPLAPDARLLVVETMNNLNLGARLDATTVSVGAQPKPADITSILDAAKEAGATIVATSDVAKNPAQTELVNALLKAKLPTIVVALRSPYDLMSFPNAPTYLAIYGNNPPMREALINVLIGRAPARGRLPVELPGLYQLGDGIVGR